MGFCGMDAPLKRRAQELVDVALEHIEAMRRCWQGERPLLGVSGFHAQQAVEIAFKALLVALGASDVPRTHSLTRLYALIERAGLRPGYNVDDLGALTTFAVAGRYSIPLDEEASEIARLLEVAENIVTDVVARVRELLGT